MRVNQFTFASALLMTGALIGVAWFAQSSGGKENGEVTGEHLVPVDPPDVMVSRASRKEIQKPDLASKSRWYKGQLHAHANWGLTELHIPTTSPDTVVRWYREHDFNFVALTDLNYFTPTAGLASVFNAPGRFIVVQGIELNHEFPTIGDTIVDTLGFNIKHPITPPVGNVPSELLQAQAEAITKAGGIAIAAHPNLTYAWGAADILATDPAKGPKLFEVWNAEPGMNPMGGGGRPSTEEIWDGVLSAGRKLYGVATDDSHHFRCTDCGIEFANPGRAWVMVHAPELTPAALANALKKGRFYATTGVEIEAYSVDAKRIRITLSDEPRDLGWSNPGRNPQLYVTRFIGQNGTVLQVDESLTPTYHFKGTELYVRAKIVNSDGQIAWTQPVFRASLDTDAWATDEAEGPQLARESM